MQNNPEYATLLRLLGQMNAEEILRVIVEAKTGRKDFCDRIPIEVDATAGGGLSPAFFLTSFQPFVKHTEIRSSFFGEFSRRCQAQIQPDDVRERK